MQIESNCDNVVLLIEMLIIFRKFLEEMERRYFLISSFLSLGLVSQKAYSSTITPTVGFSVILNDEIVGFSNLTYKKLKNGFGSSG